MPRTRFHLCLAASLLLGGHCATAAELYKWVDEHGNVAYSQQKPKGVESEALEVRTGGPSTDDSQAALEALTDRVSDSARDREFAASATA